MGAIQSGAAAGIGSLSGAAVAQLGGSKLAQSIVGKAQGAAEQAARQIANKYVPPSMALAASQSASILQSAANGNWEDVASSALQSDAFSGLAESLTGFNQDGIRERNSPLLGGGSLRNLQELTSMVLNGDHAHKNLFIIEVESLALGGGYSHPFNLYCIDVDYEPFNLTGDKQRVGGAVVDRVTGNEPADMRLTTYDNVRGDMKRFWAEHHARASARDGTVGLPRDYAIKITLLHGVMTGGNRVSSAYRDVGLFRVANLSTSLSRREPGIVELQMTLSQLDTFMRP